MTYLYILIVILIVLITFKESFSSSPGALMQLVAKGAQDIYLTGGPNDPIIPHELKMTL